MKSMKWAQALLALLAFDAQSLSLMVAGFKGASSFRTRHHGISHQMRQSGTLKAAFDDSDAARRMLETSWDTSKMGRVPADPESAAEEAYSAILQAAGGTKSADDDSIEENDTMSGIFFIDLLLPTFDITQVVEGVNLYDEVAAVEYCIALANCFKGKSEILVRTAETVRAVTKILNAREEMESRPSDGDVVFGDGNFVDNKPLDDTSEGKDSDDFRKQLLASWNDDADAAPSEDGIAIASSEPSESIETISSVPKSYRLASLFGNTLINEGPDMATKVIQAVRENALPQDDEDNIIILSAVGKDEMVAVRGLVSKYENHKKIIMVNCHFQMIPRELLGAETVYSVLPLAVKKTTSNNDSDDDDQPSRIVVLRRYPQSWEIFVDAGIGYELAETVPVNGSNKRGLGMEFVANAVTRHLEYVSRR